MTRHYPETLHALALIKQGVGKREACRRAGCDYSTVKRALKKRANK